MFHPHYIGISSFPQDPIRQLIEIRLKNLNDSNLELNKDFNKI